MKNRKNNLSEERHETEKVFSADRRILYPMVGVALTGSALFMARTDRKST